MIPLCLLRLLGHSGLRGLVGHGDEMSAEGCLETPDRVEIPFDEFRVLGVRHSGPQVVLAGLVPFMLELCSQLTKTTKLLDGFLQYASSQDNHARRVFTDRHIPRTTTLPAGGLSPGSELRSHDVREVMRARTAIQSHILGTRLQDMMRVGALLWGRTLLPDTISGMDGTGHEPRAVSI